MTFDDYQGKTRETAVYPTCFVEDKVNTVDGCNAMVEARFVYPALGLAGEAGEVEEKLKKILRDDHGLVSDKNKVEIKKELGDVLWYLAQLCDCLGISLEDCATGNLAKLADRKNRGTLQGSGDNR